MALYLPSPPGNSFHLGPAFIHFYGLMYVIGITAAILTQDGVDLAGAGLVSRVPSARWRGWPGRTW
jgi:hypothetical protein